MAGCITVYISIFDTWEIFNPLLCIIKRRGYPLLWHRSTYQHVLIRRPLNILCLLEPLIDVIPIHDVPPRVNIVFAVRLILQIIGMLPHIQH